jgi:hypothetical protein
MKAATTRSRTKEALRHSVQPSSRVRPTFSLDRASLDKCTSAAAHHIWSHSSGCGALLDHGNGPGASKCLSGLSGFLSMSEMLGCRLRFDDCNFKQEQLKNVLLVSCP